MTIIKLCGINSHDAIAAVNLAQPDYAGFVIYPNSPRHVEPVIYAALAATLSPTIRPVLVTVDADDALIDRYTQLHRPFALQLHGHEAAARCAALRTRTQLPLIKALSIATASDLRMAEMYGTDIDYLLLDAKPETGELPGGNAKSFDWSILQGFAPTQPWFLSGGLTDSNVATALAQTNAPMVDVSSGIEATKGVKDPSRMQYFVDNVRVYDQLNRS